MESNNLPKRHNGASRRYHEEFARLSPKQQAAELEFLALAVRLLLEKRAREGKSLLVPEVPRSWN